ncbi:hypothetical protein E2C01_024798 [Portunus trituberculatus]|uniref:Uncharacterized protein n=1 Tax=Portunus trituberculatus TaxID=210409 RepID=A0A5B7EDW1_PORTR|nr:hypothetical protein [Portunus trituberculatus]
MDSPTNVMTRTASVTKTATTIVTRRDDLIVVQRRKSTEMKGCQPKLFLPNQTMNQGSLDIEPRVLTRAPPRCVNYLERDRIPVITNTKKAKGKNYLLSKTEESELQKLKLGIIVLKTMAINPLTPIDLS